MTAQPLERQVVELVATDRLSIPIKSMAGKLDRARPKLALDITNNPDFTGYFQGERCYARVDYEDQMKARGMREGIEIFSAHYPRYGAILNGVIEELRAMKETHLYFGMNKGTRITADDYLDVMTNLGFTPTEAEQLYPRLMDISRKLSRKRGEERSVMIG